MADRLRLSGPNLTPGAIPILNFSYHIELGDHPGKIIGHNIELRFMEMIFYGPSYFPSDSDESYISNAISIPMYHPILEAFERIRNKRDNISFMANAKLHIINYEAKRGGTFPVGSDIFNMALTDWLKILEQAGYSGRKIIEIAIPKMPSEEYKTVIAHITQAEQFRMTGHHKECIDECREAQEAMNVILLGIDDKTTRSGKTPLPLNIISIIDKMGPNKTGNDLTSSKIQKWRESIWEMGHMGHHPNYFPTIELADSMYLSTLALLSFLSKIHAESMGQWPK